MKYSNKQKREMVQKDYDAIVDLYVKNCSQIDFYKPYVDEFLSSLLGKDILDVGCGHGIFTNYFHEKGYNAEGIDFSKNLLAVARNNYPEINFIFQDICDFKAKEKYDGIFIKNVLFHIPDADLAGRGILARLFTALKTQGKICILMEIPKEAGEQILAEEFDESLKIYYNYMMPEKVQKMLTEAGFTITDCKTITKNENATIYAYGLMAIQAVKN